MKKNYTREDAEADIHSSPFSKSLGYVNNKGDLTKAGKDVINQYPSKKNLQSWKKVRDEKNSKRWRSGSFGSVIALDKEINGDWQILFVDKMDAKRSRKKAKNLKKAMKIVKQIMKKHPRG